MVVPNIYSISDPDEVLRKFLRYKGRDEACIAFSSRKDKKYMVIHNGRTTHFGSTMPDFTRTGDEDRRERFCESKACRFVNKP